MIQISYLLSLAVCIFVLPVIFVIVTSRRENASAKLLECRPVQSISPGELFGFGWIKSLLNVYSKYMIRPQHNQSWDKLGGRIHTASARLIFSQRLITRDENNMKAVLSSQVGDWELGELRRGIPDRFTGGNIFTYEGERWKHSRSLARSAFSRETISNLAMYERHVQDFFLTVPMEGDGWSKVVDLQPLVFRLTFDMITELLYGYSVHAQSSSKRSQLGVELCATDLPDVQNLMSNMDQMADFLGFTALFGKWHKFIHSWGFIRNRRFVHQYVDWFVRRRLHQVLNSKVALGRSSDERFVLLNELSTLTQDPIQLRNETIGLLFAGRSTTAALIAWALYHLARSPRVFNKLRATILSEFGHDFDLDRTGLSELRNCKYLQFCTNEALRLGSPQPKTWREAAKDTILPSGGGADGKSPTFVPKGTTIVLDFFGMHHRSDLWGEDVEEFRPERWEGREIGWGFIPFGGGPRKCVGQQLAVTEASYVISRMVQRFDKLENMDPTDHVVYHSTITNKSGTGVTVRMHQSSP